MLVAFDTELRPMQVSVRVGQVSAIIFTYRCITDTCRGRIGKGCPKTRAAVLYQHIELETTAASFTSDKAWTESVLNDQSIKMTSPYKIIKKF